MAELLLPSGHVALFDDEDHVLVRKYSWWANPASRTTYVQTEIRSNGHRQCLMLHRLIMNPPSWLDIDHIDHNGLNCHRRNLRIATESQNLGNSQIAQSNTSGYKGVSWYKRARKWEAYVQFGGKKKTLGYFTDPWEAAQAYNASALKQWGEFALLNKRKD